MDIKDPMRVFMLSDNLHLPYSFNWISNFSLPGLNYGTVFLCAVKTAALFYLRGGCISEEGDIISYLLELAHTEVVILSHCL